MGIVDKLIRGKDGVVRAVRTKSGRDRRERAVQQLYPLELSCDIFSKGGENSSSTQQSTTSLNTKEACFKPKRQAAVEAQQRVRAILTDEESD